MHTGTKYQKERRNCHNLIQISWNESNDQRNAKR